MSNASDSTSFDNRPGPGELPCRVTTHDQSRARILARLNSFSVPAASGNTQPLAQLTSRRSDDATIALGDAWAAVLDVLSFYQERIANEGYLRTAIERRSVLELSRSIGYELAPGVSASGYLAFEVEDALGTARRAQIPSGTAIQSVPGQGEEAQTFETSESIEARADWNALRPRLLNRQRVESKRKELPGTGVLWLDGVVPGLRSGDVLVAPDGQTLLRVEQVVVDPAAGRTRVDLVEKDLLSILPEPEPIPLAEIPAPASLKLSAEAVKSYVVNAAWGEVELLAFLHAQGWDPNEVERLTAASVAVQGEEDQVLTVFRQRLGLFGADAAPYSSRPKFDETYVANDPYKDASSSWDDANGLNKRRIWEDSWGAGYRTSKRIADAVDVVLDRSVPELLPGSLIALSCPVESRIYRVCKAVHTTVMGYGMTTRATALQLDPAVADPVADANTGKAAVTNAVAGKDNFLTRNTVAYVQSESLRLCPQRSILQRQTVGQELTLDRLTLGLTVGKRVEVRGELTDAPGIFVSEVATIAAVRHAGGFTTLCFSASLQFCYRLSSIVINANLVLATHGETIENEVLGSGDGSKQNQSFVLKRGPLAFVPGDTESGRQSTLAVRVNGVRWQEVPSLVGQDGRSQCFVVQRDEGGSASVLFGNGRNGARLPSGEDNVIATYRVGGGLRGTIPAGRLQLLCSAPLGVRAVQNPWPTSGGADAELTADARSEAPITVVTLDRIVSLSDYQDAAASYPGIAKARATPLQIGGNRIIHLTLAMQDRQPLDPSSKRRTELVQRLHDRGDPAIEIRIDDHRPKLFRVQAQLIPQPGFDPTLLRSSVETALRQAFDFARRYFAQPVRAAEVYHTIQQVTGVHAVLLKSLYVAQATAQPTWNSELLAEPAQVCSGPDNQPKTVGAELLLLQLLPGDVEVEVAP